MTCPHCDLPGPQHRSEAECLQAALKALKEQQRPRRIPASRGAHYLATHFQHWIDSIEARDGPIADDAHIMAPPSWPTKADLEAWIKLLWEL